MREHQGVSNCRVRPARPLGGLRLERGSPRGVADTLFISAFSSDFCDASVAPASRASEV